MKLVPMRKSLHERACPSIRHSTKDSRQSKRPVMLKVGLIRCDQSRIALFALTGFQPQCAGCIAWRRIEHQNPS